MDQSSVVTKRVGLVLEVMLDRPKANAIDVETYHNSILNFDNCRIPKTQMLGAPHQGFKFMGQKVY